MSSEPAAMISALTSRVARLAGWLMRRWAEYRAASAESRWLLKMSDREMRDIGITRVDAVRLASRSLRAQRKGAADKGSADIDRLGS
jgi:uncharacterized protein YjiS (DUF1127 family)